jgi:hypothetical protein
MKICEVCGCIPDDCECWKCSGCEEKHPLEDSLCPNCNMCEVCCSCEHCGECGVAVDCLEACGVCPTCCSCDEELEGEVT